MMGLCFNPSKEEKNGIIERQEINLDAYFLLARFSKKIRLITTKENFENCQNMIEHLKVINKFIPRFNDRKQICVINETS